MKNITRKIFNKYTGSLAGVAGSVLAAHVALLQFPDLVSDPLEKYMKEHDIPLALVKDIDTSNIRVYDNDSILAPMHGAAFKTQYAMKNSIWLHQAYYNGFMDVYNVGYDKGGATMFSDGADTIIATYDETPFEYISRHTGIPVEDIEIDEKYTDLIRFKILMHEISHIGWREYKSSCADYKPPTDEDSYTRSRETIADLDSIEPMKNIDVDMSKYILSFRALTQGKGTVTSYNRENIISSHDTAVYLDALLEGKECDDLPDFDGHDEDKARLSNIMINYGASAPYNFPDYQSESYSIYHILLDFLENIDAHDDVAPRIKRTAELYVEGVEFFAPTRAAEIRAQRDLMNDNTNELVPSV